jgi:hypothetical protein
MATELEPRKSTSKNEEFLERGFAQVCARIRRVDLATCVLTLALISAVYALTVGSIDYFVGDWPSLFRWIAFGTFVGLVCLQLVRTVRCAFRPINPYYVAVQLEQTWPTAKNSLVNWLDLHDEPLPAAFRKNLSANAAEHFKECDAGPILRKRKNRIMLGILAVPGAGLLVLLILGPLAFFASMQRAFLPFLDAQVVPRTQITLLQPAADVVEVSPSQPLTFAARIEGRVPAEDRLDGPQLRYRYQANEDYRSQRLQPEGDGTWTTRLLPEQLRTGFSYLISAGDVSTDENQVRVRAAAHVKTFAITYHHRPYRRLPDRTITFPNQAASNPVIQGPCGSEVELVMTASRPVGKAQVEMVLTNNVKKEVPVRMIAGDPKRFACRWTLEQPAKFRVLFTSSDGDENIDRAYYNIDVVNDAAPTVVLTRPAKETSVPANASFFVEGKANSSFGLKSLALRLRVAVGPDKDLQLQPKKYLPDKSFRFDDGRYPDTIEYQDFVSLDQLKTSRGVIHYFPAGTVLEYWLEASDCTDFPHPDGNVGMSEPKHKVTLLPPVANDAWLREQRKKAAEKQQQFEKSQNDKQQKENKNRGKNGRGGSAKSDEEQLKDTENKTQGVKEKLDKANENKERGGAKGAGQNQPQSKQGPQDSADAPEPQTKDQQPMSPDDTGNSKDHGDKQGSSGEAKGDAGQDPHKKQEDGSHGERKEGPKQAPGPAKDQGPGKAEPAGGAKEGGPMSKDAPAPSPAKDNAAEAGAPQPQSKQDAKNDSSETPGPGSAKGIEQEGPKPANKDQQSAKQNEPAAKTKGAPSDANESKAGLKSASPELAKQAGQSRGDNPSSEKREPTPADVGKLIEQLAKHDSASNAAAEKLAKAGKESSDPRLGNIAKEALTANQRDPNTGKLDEKKIPNPFGSNGQSSGVGDDVKTAAANREFLRRIGQLQLNDWKKRMTPALLQKAGLTEAEWQRFLTDMQRYDALVRELNAKMARNPRPTTTPRPQTSTGPRRVDSPQTNTEPIQAGAALPPADLLEPQRIFSTRTK